ncbi:Glucosidase 2 subunit beta [Phytophthora megakarya]|uniref:Glucosidase 2 subunit beta n=1 Tax=Phytophthora megakarya TaxID=4795 RepID=A0A225ULC5_9STRA|nr:Glucosidase 2 subunit beta [Phytophthora megakarya]
MVGLNEQKYEYKFCAFSEIKQDRTNLGKWDGWSVEEMKDSSATTTQVDHSKMRYSKGQRCYKGPERSVVVHLECGAENEILNVDEPSTCVYEMNVRSPLACTAQVLAKAEEDVAFWSRAP